MTTRTYLIDDSILFDDGSAGDTETITRRGVILDDGPTALDAGCLYTSLVEHSGVGMRRPTIVGVLCELRAQIEGNEKRDLRSI